MSKLYFRYGAMNSGKTTALLQAAYNYGERGQRAILVKPGTDTKAGRLISSRLGAEREVDVLLVGEESLLEAFGRQNAEGDVSAVFVDEAQFLTPQQVEEAFDIAVLCGVPVLCYGLRSDFKTRAFPGSARLMEISHSIEELKTICRCGSKAIFNARLIGGSFVSDGAQVAIDGQHAGYESLCGRCYVREVGPVAFNRQAKIPPPASRVARL